MTCRELVNVLIDYLEDDLTAAQRSVFEEHLSECSACVAYMKTYEETIRLGKGAFADPDGEVPEEVPEELVRAVLAARRAKD